MTLNLTTFTTTFPDEESCIAYLTKLRWPTGIACLRCGSVSINALQTRAIYQCRDCRRQFSAKTGTPFERSRVPLQKWFLALYMLTTFKRGVASTQIAEAIGVTQKTAWRMMHALRGVMGTDFELFGSVEIDETYIHPNTYKRSSARRVYGRTGSRTGQVVFGMVERGGRVKMLHVKSSGARILNPLIDQYVATGSRVYTDEHGSYRLLSRRGYDHLTTNHSRNEFVVGDNYTQNIENVWSHLKRGIKGVYYHISKQHLQLYCHEFEYRYNHRGQSNQERFDDWFANIDRRAKPRIAK